MEQKKISFIKKNLAPVLAIISIVLAAVILAIFTEKKDTSDKTITSEYLEDITYTEMVKLFEDKKDFILYVGSADCPHCEEFAPKFIEVLEENKVTAYYLDLSTVKDDEYNDLRNYVSISGTPTVVFITDGTEESTLNRISASNVTTNYIYEKLKANGYINE